MPKPTFDSIHLQDCLDRWRGGDRGAADDLLRGTGARLEKLARRMTRAFPNVRRHSDSGDVLQNSTIRLLRSLQTMRPATTRDYFNLAAVHIRRELLDLARRCKGKAWAPFEAPDLDCARAEPASEATLDFDLWVRFHQAVDDLPAEEREVVGLVFYHGWTQVRIADLFAVDERTIRRRWAKACERLREAIGDDRV